MPRREKECYEPSWQTVYHHWRKWSADGSLEWVWRASLKSMKINLALSELNLDDLIRNPDVEQANETDKIAGHLDVETLEKRYRESAEGVTRSHWQIVWLLAKAGFACYLSDYSRD